jgi:hypothetical protein
LTIQNPSKSKLYPTETINGIKVTNTTGQKGDGGRILAWKGSIPAEFKRAAPETSKSKE